MRRKTLHIKYKMKTDLHIKIKPGQAGTQKRLIWRKRQLKNLAPSPSLLSRLKQAEVSGADETRDRPKKKSFMFTI